MVTTVYICGFECGLSTTDVVGVGQHLRNVPAGITFSTTTVRSGARSLRNLNSSAATLPSFASSTTYVWRMYVRFATLPSTDCFLGAVDYTGTSAGPGFKQSDSTIRSYVDIAGVPTFGATGVVVTTGVWYRVDVKSVGSVVAGTVDVQVDGTAVAQVTGAFASANATAMVVGSLSAPTHETFFDDLVVSQTAGDYPITATDSKVIALVPTSDGTHNVAGANDFDRTLTGTDIDNTTTTAWQLVDAVPFIATDISAVECITITAPPNATDYVQCVFGPAPSSSAVTTETVLGVEVLGALQTASAGGSPTMDLSLRINDGGTTGDVFTSSVFYQPSTPVFKPAHFAVAPSTGAAWTAAKVNALQVRFGSFDAADSAPDGYFGTVMCEVALAPVAFDVATVAAYEGLGMLRQPMTPRTQVVAY